MTPPTLAKVDIAPSAPFLTQVGYNSQVCRQTIPNVPVTQSLLKVANVVVIHCESELENHIQKFENIWLTFLKINFFIFFFLTCLNVIFSSFIERWRQNCRKEMLENYSEEKMLHEKKNHHLYTSFMELLLKIKNNTPRNCSTDFEL